MEDGLPGKEHRIARGAAKWKFRSDTGEPEVRDQKKKGLCEEERTKLEHWMQCRESEGGRGPNTTEYPKVKMVYGLLMKHGVATDPQYRKLVGDDGLTLRDIQFVKSLVRDKPTSRASSMIYVSPEWVKSRCEKEAIRCWKKPKVRDLYEYLIDLDDQYADAEDDMTPEFIIRKLEKQFRVATATADVIKLSELIIKYRNFNMDPIQVERDKAEEDRPITRKETDLLASTMESMGLESSTAAIDEEEADDDSFQRSGVGNGAGLLSDAEEEPGATVYSPIPLPEDGEELGED